MKVFKFKYFFISLLVLVFTVSLTTSVLGQSGNMVVWGEDDQMATLDPRITQSRHELQIIRQVFDSLITKDEDGNYIPWLAESWEVSDDYTEYTFHLKEGVKFHDGTPLTAEAFKFTYDSIQDPELGSQGAIDYLGPYKETVVEDEYTFTVVFERPYAAAMNAFTLTYLAPVSPAAVEKYGKDFSEHPVGTGPFKFVEWERRDHVTLEKFEDYNWAPEEKFDHQGPAYLDKLRFNIIEESSTRVAALRKGEIDIGDLLPVLDMKELAESDEFETILGSVSGVPVTMYMNTSRFPTDDVNVRKAVHYAVDQKELVDRVFFEYLEPAYGPLAETTPCYWEGAEEAYPKDLEKARDLLKRSGWTHEDNDEIREKDGKDLDIYTPIIFKSTLMTALQAELKKVGINLNVENVTKNRQDELIMNNEYDAGLVRWVATDPSVLRIIYHSENIPEPGYFKFNWQHYANDYMDYLIKAGEMAATPEEKCEEYQKVQEMSMDLALTLPLQETTQTVAYKSGLTGLEWEVGNYQIMFYDAKWE